MTFTLVRTRYLGVMKRDIKAEAVNRMFTSIADRYDLANTLLSFGIHYLWKAKLASRISKYSRGFLLDVCTGTGDLLPLFVKRGFSVLGVDFTYAMLRAGVRSNRHFSPVVQGDALKLPVQTESMDAITVAFGVRNLERLGDGLKDFHRVLKQGGTLGILEFGQPDGVIFGPLYRFYSRYILPLIGRCITGNADAYRYLPETAESFPCGDKFSQILNSNGFKVKELIRLTGGIAFIYIAQKDSSR